jgi:hypothetical protein
MAEVSAHPITVVSEKLPASKANAGWARKRAMDIAATRLVQAKHGDGLILTTDADSVVAPTWIDATRRAIADGADCVAGYIDAQPAEIMRLGGAFIERGRLEDSYIAMVAEIYARCDPRPHDPWPNHRVSSGASLAVTIDAYFSIGGLPPKPVGEDAAMTAAVERAGLRVRHSMDVCVSTSCRFDGRAKGGAADTMRLRHDVLEAPCDDDLEPALSTVRRALLKGWLRRCANGGNLGDLAWASKAGLSRAAADVALKRWLTGGFEEFWSQVAESSCKLRARRVLRPSDLPHQMKRAAMCLRALRKASALKPPTSDPVDIADLPVPCELADA